MFKTSENGIAFLKEAEGYIAVPKMDTTKMQWGYGHNRVGSEPIPSFVSLTQADAILRADLPGREAAVNYLAPWANQNQFDALVSFTYNLGDGDLHTMLAHGKAVVSVQMLRWDNVAGKPNAAILERRKKEVALYES